MLVLLVRALFWLIWLLSWLRPRSGLSSLGESSARDRVVVVKARRHRGSRLWRQDWHTKGIKARPDRGAAIGVVIGTGLALGEVDGFARLLCMRLKLSGLPRPRRRAALKHAYPYFACRGARQVSTSLDEHTQERRLYESSALACCGQYESATAIRLLPMPCCTPAIAL